MRLNINTIKDGHVSLDTVMEIEETILNDETVFPVRKINESVLKYYYLLIRVLRKLKIPVFSKTSNRFLKQPFQDRNHLFTMMMGLDEAKYKPFSFFTNHCRSVYMIDAWPKDHDLIVQFVIKNKIDYLFVSSSQATERLNKRLPNKFIRWIPEGIQADNYRYCSYEKKSIDVLAFGRKYDLLHLLIKDKFNEKGIIYLYEKEKGKIIFPTRHEFIEGLSKTKIAICITANITHPERSGDIETMNIRYLQCIVSKCLMVGHAPAEMVELFGYNPVIEIDMKNPVEQIINILENYANYIPLIEKNYREVINNHTWQHRWEQIKSIYQANSTK